MRRSLGVAAAAAAGVAFAAAMLAALAGPDDVVGLPSRPVSTAGVAVITNPNVVSRVGPTVHVTARRADPAPPGSPGLLLALGHTEDVRSYVGDAPHTVVVQVLPELGRLRTKDVAGGAPLPGKPLGQDFWVLQSSGPGVATVRWPTTDGVWSWALLNSDGSPGVVAEVQVGVEVPGLFAWSLGLLAAVVVGTAAVGAGVTLRRRRRVRAVTGDSSAAAPDRAGHRHRRGPRPPRRRVDAG
jgi:hypothetical protein